MNSFQLDIMTPKQHFFSGSVEALIVHAPDGELAVLAGHAPMIVAVRDGGMQIKQDGQWKNAFHSVGFLEVAPGGTTLFAQVCEWADDIDAARAREEQRREEEHMRQRQSIAEHRSSQIALARAMARLRITHQQNRMD